MKIVGHSSVTITSKYLENTQSELDELVLGLGAPAPVPAAARSVALAS